MVAMMPTTSYDDATMPPPPPDGEAQAIVPYGPKPPKWYRKPPKPELADVLARAEEERAAHQPRVDQGHKMLRRINPDEDNTMAGVFTRLHKKAISGEVERIALPGLRDETDAAVGFVAQMDWVPEALYRSSLDRDKAAAKEDLCAYLAECAQRQYSRSGGTSLKAAKAFNLWVHGCVAEFNGLDVDNDECGLRMRLIDPSTIYPVWEGERGLLCVYLKYQQTAADFIGTHGAIDDFDEEAVRRSASTSGESYDPNYVGTVVEYWDRAHALIAWEDAEVASVEHDYAEVPFTITPGNFGQPINVIAPDPLRSAYGASWTSDRAQDLMRVYQPFLARRVAMHQFNEAVTGVLATKVRRSLNPARTLKSGVLTYEEESPKFSDDEGTTTKIREGDEAEVNEYSVSMDPGVASALFAVLQKAEATSTPSSLIAGQAPMSQGSGTALNVLRAGGYERWTLFVLALEQHETMATEQRLRFIRDYGELLGMDGTLYVPRRGRPNTRTGQSAAHEVTSDLLKDTGIRVQVTFRRFNPSELTSLAQGVGMMRSLNMMPRRDGIEIVGYTADPDRAIEEIDREMLNEVPEIAQKNMLSLLIEDLQEAGWRGNEEDVERLMYDLMYVASRTEIERDTRETEQTTTAQMKVAAGMGALGPSMNGQTGNANLPVGTQGGNTGGPSGAVPPIPNLAMPQGY
jgi:hypothetical protein